MKNGTFIVVEGGEGVGKSTFVSALCNHFNKHSPGSAVSTHEPGGTPLGCAVRRIFLRSHTAIHNKAQILLINAARLQHWHDIIKPNLQRGTHVICDRFVDSTRVYQGWMQEGDIGQQAMDWIDHLHERLFCDEVCHPHLTFIVDIEPKSSLERIHQRAPHQRTHLDNQSLPFHTKVREGFLYLAQKGGSYHVLNGHQPVEQLVQEALCALSGLNTCIK